MGDGVTPSPTLRRTDYPHRPLPSHRQGPARIGRTTKEVTVDQLLDTRPVSAQWRRVLLERLDALAVIYRVSAALSNAAFPIRFRWCRAGPADAGIVLPDGRCLAVVRQGNTADRATFAKRLWRLSEEARPGGVLLLAPDDVRLRQASRALDSLPLLGFLALEGDAAAGANAAGQVWRTPSAPVPLSLREVLDYVRPGGELPAEPPPRRESLPADLDLDSPANEVPTCLLPVLLKPAGKRALDLLSDWPWLATAPPGAVDREWGGPGSTRYLERLRELGLVMAVDAEGHRCLVLSDKGLAALARRDRTAVGLARQRWSAAPVKPESTVVLAQRPRLPQPPTAAQPGPHPGRPLVPGGAGQSSPVSGLASRAALTRPRRATRFFRHDDRLHSVRPDAFGVLKREGKERPFFLEWERRAVRPVTMAARIAPYLRYYATRRPLDDHGAVPLVMVVFDDDLAADHFLRVAGDEMRRAGVKVPLWVSHRNDLKRSGPLGKAWQRQGTWKPPRSFA